MASLEGDRTFLVLLCCLPTKDSLQHSSVFNQAFPRFHDNLLLLLWNASSCGSETFWSCHGHPGDPHQAQSLHRLMTTVTRPMSCAVAASDFCCRVSCLLSSDGHAKVDQQILGCIWTQNLIIG